MPIQRIKKFFSRELGITSVIGGFTLLAGPLERDLTVVKSHMEYIYHILTYY